MTDSDSIRLGSFGLSVTNIDEQRLQELIDAHGAALTLYARQWCHDPDEAVQEAFVDLARTHSVPRDPLAWLYTTVRRRAMNVARAESRRARHHRQAREQVEMWFIPDDDEDAIDAQAALAELPRLEREIVVAHIWGGLTFAQIAELVGQPSSSVHRRYKRALATLAQTLKHELSGTES